MATCSGGGALAISAAAVGRMAWTSAAGSRRIAGRVFRMTEWTHMVGEGAGNQPSDVGKRGGDKA